VPQEKPSVIENKRPPAYWPSNTGRITIEDLVVRYAPSLPPVLKGISAMIEPSEKIGLVNVFFYILL
jgi:ABC-type multidrug transport system fused ATPase/permease subunit